MRLRQETGTLVFEVADDGRGFAPEASAGGAGLTSMLDRIRALGGVKRPGSA